ncbi:MAG: diguanylate cyclase [Hyphomicrobiales bacterium]|nr:diguanylate cyclase [Hyphomicrobiales bacterium]
MTKGDRSHTTQQIRKPTLSIRARLVILALLAVVPLMLDRVRHLEQTRAERIEHAASEALELARRGADGQREIIIATRAMLQVMARAYVSTLAAGVSCSAFLFDMTAGMPWINGLSIVGADGKVKCSTIATAIGVDLSDQPHLRHAMESREFVVSNHLIGRLNRKPTFVAVYPTQAIDSRVEAAVITAVDLQWVSTLMSTLERRSGSSVLLIDGAGTIIAGDRGRAAWAGKRIDQTAFYRRLGTTDEGTARGEGLDGVRRIFGFVRITSSDAHLVVGLNEADALQRIDREITLAYLQLAFFGLLVLMLAWFGGERLIVDPIRSLARVAERFGNGDLRARASRAAWAREFAPLTAALNDMAQRLAERERQLRAANDHLRELATSDALSGLANRRGFDARLAADWQRAAKFDRPMALLMIDVDHFKLFNDRYGHVEGDVCLRRIGRLLKEAASGDDDLPARYGGEEFALLLPGADIETARRTAERLRRAVEELCIAHAASPSGQVTVSIGVASLIPGVAEEVERLVEAADIALYAAKRRGRNTVVVHGTVALIDQPDGSVVQPEAA